MKFYIHKLGCPKNDVDADYIAARLTADGHEYVSDPKKAESILINTCGFINEAKEESIDEILRLARLKQTGQLKQLLATGCLTQRYGDEMLRDMPELDGAFGHGALNSIAAALGKPKGDRPERATRLETRKLGYISWKHRFITDPFPYSYVKISDGCDRACTYCAIPGMRGRFRSRPIDSIVAEARFLAENGKRELILVSQEATCYGFDFGDGTTILDLLRALEAVDGIEWIRLMYLYPAALHEELIEYMTSGTKAVPYFDLPLQHVNEEILVAMRRQIERKRIEYLLDKIRARNGDGIVRTTFIVGFPGETESQFEELCDFVEESRFDRMGVFAYSAEENTPAASYERQIPDELQLERVDRIMSLQREIAFEKNNSLIGNRCAVIIDSVSEDGRGQGRTAGDCPEIDQEVSVTGKNVAIGDFVTVEITATDGYDLSGTVVGELGS